MADIEQVMAKAAMEWHKDTVRKYTGEPYEIHLAEVAGLVGLLDEVPGIPKALLRCIGWGHDLIEDCDVNVSMIRAKLCNFARKDVAVITRGIVGMTDSKEGNRSVRVAEAILRLSKAPAWVQSIKCLDIYSNLKSIIVHDISFARVCTKEMHLKIEAMAEADPTAKRMARAMIEKAELAVIHEHLRKKELHEASKPMAATITGTDE